MQVTMLESYGRLRKGQTYQAADKGRDWVRVGRQLVPSALVESVEAAIPRADVLEYRAMGAIKDHVTLCKHGLPVWSFYCKHCRGRGVAQ